MDRAVSYSKKGMVDMSQNLTVQQKHQKMREFLMGQEERVARVLPKHMTPERMCQVMALACGKQPALLDCTPASLVTSLMQASELGLEFSGVLGQAAIIPYGKIATFQPMYQGLVDLSYRSGKIDTIQAHVVYEGDTFDYELGTNPRLSHKPTLGEKGEPIGAYCRVMLKGSQEPLTHFMSKSEIEDHRDKYSKAWNGPRRKECPWYTAPLAMWKKTVFLQLQKWIPKSPEMQKAIGYDAAAETGQSLAELGLEPIDIPSEEVAPETAESAPVEPTQDGSEALEAAAIELEAEATSADLFGTDEPKPSFVDRG